MRKSLAGYTSAGQIALESFSAGGVVAGALINSHANLLLAAILQVPFLDVLTVLTDENQPLTVHEYEEWGDPHNPNDFVRVPSLLSCYCQRHILSVPR